MCECISVGVSADVGCAGVGGKHEHRLLGREHEHESTSTCSMTTAAMHPFFCSCALPDHVHTLVCPKTLDLMRKQLLPAPAACQPASCLFLLRASLPPAPWRRCNLRCSASDCDPVCVGGAEQGLQFAIREGGRTVGAGKVSEVL